MINIHKQQVFKLSEYKICQLFLSKACFFVYDKAIYRMSNNISFFKRIYTVSVFRVENWIATVEMSFHITTYTGNVVASGITSREMNGRERRRRRRNHERRLWYLMISQCIPRARKFVLRLMYMQYHNGNTKSFHLFSDDGEILKDAMEHFQKWLLSKASFGRHDCKSMALWPKLFQNSFDGCRNLASLHGIASIVSQIARIFSRVIKSSPFLSH